jgi:DNA modification methylase
MHFRIEDRLQWGEDATFIPNKFFPVYNWFYYKEGYSRSLVLNTLDMFNSPASKGFVLDPFCGVGTTNLACRERGINSVGFDVSPLALFSAKVKCRSYDAGRLKRAFSVFRQARFEMPDKAWVSGDVKRFFNPHTLDDVLFFAKEVEKIDDAETRDFFRLGLITTATRCSYMYKDGSMLKRVKHPVPPFRKVYFARLKRMIHDLDKIRVKKCSTIISHGDARRLKLEDEAIDCVITSPPYLNKIEYTKIYRVEEALFFRYFSESGGEGIRSYIGHDAASEIIFPDLPVSSNAYFSDMNRMMKELYRVCKPGAKLAIVVGNGCFPDRVVESDSLLAQLAKDAGFEVKNIFVLNKRWCMRNRVEKVGPLRESMIVLEK